MTSETPTPIVGRCSKCGGDLSAHGARCLACEDAQRRWVERTFTVRLDEGTYGSSPDDDEISYLLRMGGIDAEPVAEGGDVSALAAASPTGHTSPNFAGPPPADLVTRLLQRCEGVPSMPTSDWQLLHAAADALAGLQQEVDEQAADITRLMREREATEALARSMAGAIGYDTAGDDWVAKAATLGAERAEVAGLPERWRGQVRPDHPRAVQLAALHCAGELEAALGIPQQIELATKGCAPPP